MAAGTDAPTLPSLEAMLGPHLTAEQARAIFRQGEEAVVFALLTLAKQVAPPKGGSGPTTPSGMTPVYEKPTTKHRRKKPGRKAGHAGSRRPRPRHIDRHEEHTLTTCPTCHGPVAPCLSTGLLPPLPTKTTELG